MKKKAVITGGAGFIGSALSSALVKKGYLVTVVSKAPEKAGPAENVKYISYFHAGLVKAIDGSSCVINLSGENIGSGAWTGSKKKKIVSSGVSAGEKIIGAVRKCKNKPKCLIQASAVGFYGSRGEQMVAEQEEQGTGFLPDVCKKWESSTAKAEKYGVRRIIIRSGIVLGKTGGILPRMALPFKFFLGAVPGRGTQWMPWIDIEDEISAIIYLAENKKASGIFNLTSPGVISSSEFSYVLGKMLKRPVFLKIPSFMIRLIFGKAGEELVLSSLKVIPKRLLEIGFSFKYPAVDKSLEKNLHHGLKPKA